VEITDHQHALKQWHRLAAAESRHDHGRRFAALTALEDLHFGTIPRVTSEGLTEGLKPLTALTSLTLVRTAPASTWMERAVPQDCRDPGLPSSTLRLSAFNVSAT